MKVQLEFDLTDRGSRSALMTMISAIDRLDTEPERRRDSDDEHGDNVSNAATLHVSSAEAGEVGVSEPAPARVNGGDISPPTDRGDSEAGVEAPQPRRRGRRAAPAAEDPPQPPTVPPADGTTDLSGPDEETIPPHSILGEPVSIDIIEKDGVGRSKITGRKHELSVTEAREIAVKHLREVFTTGGPKAKSEVAAYQRELGLKAFSDVPDERAYDMYRRSIEMMHAIGKSA